MGLEQCLMSVRPLKTRLNIVPTPINNLPNSITHLFFGDYFNHSVDNLPSTIKEIKIYKKQMGLLTKIPFECEIICKKDNIF